MVTKEVATREQGMAESVRREVAAQGPEPLMVSSNYVQQTVHSIALLQDMTRSLLKRGRDFGRTPGTQSDGLWDPGAQLIISSFNCYAGRRRVLSLVDEENKIVVILEIPIISRQSGQEVGSGIGAASTLETKYNNLWLYPSELKELGYTDEQIATLKTNKKHAGKHCIENPDRGGLINTLVKMASKRAEVDAAEALPGVASVLREMFTPAEREREGKAGSPAAKYEGAKWQRFWGEAQRLGYSEAEVHTALKVKSMQDWLAAGKSLDDATTELVRLAAEASGMAPTDGPAPDTGKAAQGAQSEGRAFDLTMVRSAASKLKWDAKKLNKEMETRFGIVSLDIASDAKLHEAASKLTDLAEAA